MATRLMTPFCIASVLFASLVADGTLPVSWAQMKAGPSAGKSVEGQMATAPAPAAAVTAKAG